VVTDPLAQDAPLACPVCGEVDQDWSSNTVCKICGWPQRMEPGSAPPAAPASELERAREAWARQLWQTRQATHEPEVHRNYLISGMEWLIDRTHEIAEINLAERLDRLESRIEAQFNLQFNSQFNPEPAIADDLPLYSELGIDYVPLAMALSQADWRTADALTDELIRTAIARNRPPHANQAPDFFRPNSRSHTILDDIADFPATDLQTIAWAWAAYSHGRLGLVAQISQWTGDYATFCDRVGWRNPRGWKYYDQLRFEPETLEAMPIGHFPVLGWRKRACYGLGGETAAQIMVAWFDRWQQIADLGEIV